MTTTTAARGITERQIAYLTDLAVKLTGEPADSPGIAKVQASARGLTRRQASEMIDQFKSLVAAERAKRAAPPPIAVGFYEHEGKAYEVCQSRDGRRTYAMVLDTERGKFVYAKGAIYHLQDSRPLTLQEAAAFSRRLKRCIVCGRRLELLASQQRGIGPVCAKRFG